MDGDLKARMTDLAALVPDLERAVALHGAGRLDEAETLYRAVLERAPWHAGIVERLAVLQFERGRSEDALSLFGRALEIDPGHVAALTNLGVLLRTLDRPAEALASFERALEREPDFKEALYNRGNLLAALGRPQDALANYDRVILLHPDFAEAHNNRGLALIDLARPADAVSDFDRALQLRPDYAEAASNRADALLLLGQPQDALTGFDQALHLRPDLAETHNNRGRALTHLGRPEEALVSHDRALAIRPRDPSALGNRAEALKALGRLDEAARALALALEIDPERRNAAGRLMRLRLQACDWDGFEALSARIEAGIERGEQTDMPWPFLAHSRNATLQRRCAEIFAGSGHPAWTAPPYRHDRIRVAWLSPDFYAHATSILAAGMLERIDRSRFENFGISSCPDDGSPMRARLRKAFEQFVDVRGWPAERVAQWLREREIDIAVDLTGFVGDSQTAVFARRCAPIQVNFLGYAGTMGGAFIDYILADPYVIPPAHEAFYGEKVARLPDTYQPNDRKRAIAARAPTRKKLGLPQNGFVFCCFNDNYKIQPDVFGVWMKLLREIDGSVLWLLRGNAIAETNLRREAERRGVSADRLVFAPHVSPEQHLARHRAADLFVDTFPYNAHTTASDALWAGLPLVTWSGETFASRVAGSLLTAVGLAELIAGNIEDYEASIRKLATTPKELARLRAKLARNRLTHPLFDSERFSRHIEAAFTTMYDRYQSGLPPHGFDVPAAS
jgi:predicted O-linked N-acetylglucosamine transferase (SPINDLY family)